MKKCLLLLLTLLLLSGCAVTRMDNKSYEEVMDKILSLDIKLYNKIGKGYKYYTPKGIVRTDSNTYNDVLTRDDITYYLYIDVVGYYYKTDLDYKVNKNAYYSRKIENGKKNGYVQITNKDNKLFVQMVYNYAKIETYVDKKDLNTAIEDISYILSSVKFNDSLLKKLQESGNFGSKEEVYKLFNNKERDGNFLEYIKEYDKYEADDDSSVAEKEVELKQSTTTTTTTTTIATTTEKKDETTNDSE